MAKPKPFDLETVKAEFIKLPSIGEMTEQYQALGEWIHELIEDRQNIQRADIQLLEDLKKTVKAGEPHPAS